VCRQAVPHILGGKKRAATLSGPSESLIENYGNSTHFDIEDRGGVMLKNVGNIATAYAGPQHPKICGAAGCIQYNGSPRGISGEINGTRQIFLREHRFSLLVQFHYCSKFIF
jgi:hypothetical protein